MPKHSHRHRSHKPGDDIPPEKEYTPADQKTLKTDEKALLIPDAPVAGTTFTETIQDAEGNDVDIEGAYIRLYITSSEIQRIFNRLSSTRPAMIANISGTKVTPEVKLAEISKYVDGRRELAKYLKPTAAFVEGIYQPMIVKEYQVLPDGRKAMLDPDSPAADLGGGLVGGGGSVFPGGYKVGDGVAASKHLRAPFGKVLQADGTYDDNPAAANVGDYIRLVMYGHNRR